MAGHETFEQQSEIVGDRVVLRPLERDDAPHIVRWRSDPEILANFFSTEPLRREAHLKWFDGPRENRVDYVICMKISGKPIGTVAFSNINSEKREAEKGILIGEKSEWRKGLGAEALVLWLDYGFRCLGFDRIIARVFAANAANLALCKKVGFREESTGEHVDPDGGKRTVRCLCLTREAARETGLFSV